MTILTIFIYLLLQLMLCYWLSKKIKTESDYLIGRRQFPTWVLGISLFATWFGAETCIGSAAAVYESGLSGSRTDPFGYSLCLFLSGVLIARKIWKENYITLSDFFNDRFGSTTGQMAIWILSLSSLIWAAAQLRAFGQIISATTNFNYHIALLLGLCFVVLYTMFGGLSGDIITDVIQAFVIIVGLVLLVTTVVYQTADYSILKQQFTPERLRFFSSDESWLQRIDRWAIPILGSLVAQEIISRLFAARDKSAAEKSCYVGGSIYLVLGVLPVGLGLIGPALIYMGSNDPEQFLILLAEKFFSPVWMGILAAAIISALLSTTDSILLSISALVSHNFIIPKLRITKASAQVITSRLVVLLAALLAYTLAAYSTSIYELLESASTFGTAGILVITLMGLWFKIGDQFTSIITLVAGIIITPLFEHVLQLQAPFIFSILVCLGFYLGLGIYRQKCLPQTVSL